MTGRGAAIALVAGTCASIAMPGCAGTHGGEAAPAPPLRMLGAYGRLPMAFERNVGQADRRARFVARGRGYTLLLTDRAPLLGLRHGRGARPATSWLTLGLAGTARRMHVRPGVRAAGAVNYLLGRDRSRWRLHVPTYAGVRYADAYPGIAVAFRGTNSAAEYDFHVAPGADPGVIALRPRGQRSARITRGGDLVLAFAGGVLREAAPLAYQLVSGHRVRVRSRFARRRDGAIGIRLGGYDPARALVIDPVLTYSTFLGAAGADNANAIAVDAGGAAYVTGTTGSTGFPTSAGAFQTTSGGDQDVFVTKLSPAGDSRAYSTFLGGTSIDIGNGIAIDAAGDAYVTGATSSANFPVTAAALQPANAGGNSDAFVAKLTPAGDGLAYSTFLGGTAADTGYAIAVDGTGASYVAGQTSSSGFPTTAGAAQPAIGGGSDAFVAKLAPAGATLAFSTFLGGTAQELADGIALDSSGAAYVTGLTGSANFPVTAGVAQSALRGSTDAFATRVAPSGAALSYSTYLGGSGQEQGYATAVDRSGSAYVTGSTYSSDFPVTAGAEQTTAGGGVDDAFVTKLSPAGDSRTYSTYLGGSGAETGRAIALDSAGEAYVAGLTASSDFPTTAGAVQSTLRGGGGSAFLSKLSAAGVSMSYSTFLGGNQGAAAFGVAVDAAGAAYLTGATPSSDFPTTGGAAQTSNGGSTDAFVTKLVPPPAPAPAPTPTTTTTTPTQTTPAPGPLAITTRRPRIHWNWVFVDYRLSGGTGVQIDVTAPGGRTAFSTQQQGASGTLYWNRRIGSRVAPPGRYRVRFTAHGTGGATAVKTITVTLGVLYPHPPYVTANALQVDYELAVPAVVTLAVATRGVRRVVVARHHGHRGFNQIGWNLRLHGRRAPGGSYRLTVTARTPAGGTYRVAVPAARRHR